MNHTAAMTKAYPRAINSDRDLQARCIEACSDCANACTACADACVSENAVETLVKCIRANLDCADVCIATGRILSRQTGYDADNTRVVLKSCMRDCSSRGDACERHGAQLEHCRICAEACRRCAEICRVLALMSLTSDTAWDLKRTPMPNIFAVGDVVGGLMLAHTAAQPGRVAAATILGEALAYDQAKTAT